MSNLSPPSKNETSLTELFATIWAHKLLIALLTCIFVFLGGYYYIRADKEFTAKAIFQIEQGNKPGFNLSAELGVLASFAGLSSIDNSQTDALLERITGREFILNVSRKSSLDSDPFFNSYNPNQKDTFGRLV